MVCIVSSSPKPNDQIYDGEYNEYHSFNLVIQKSNQAENQENFKFKLYYYHHHSAVAEFVSFMIIYLLFSNNFENVVSVCFSFIP